MIVLARLFLPQKSFESCRCGRMSLFLFLVALLVLLLCPTRGLRTLQLRFGWTTGGRSGTGWLRQFPASKPFPGCSPSLSSDQVMSRYRAVLLWASPQQNHRREQIYKRRGKDDRADGRRDTNINNSTSISSSKNAPLLSLPENINYDRLVMDLKDFAYKQRQGAPNSRYALIYPQANPNQATINSSRDSVRVRMEELPLILLQGLNQLTVNQLSDLVWSLGALAKLDRPSAVQNGQMTKDLVFSAVVQFASLQEVFFSSLTVQQRIAASLETSKLLVGLARLGLSWQALSLHSPNSSSAYSLLPNTTAFAAALRNEEERQSSLVMLQSYLVPTILRSLQFARAQGLSNTMHSLAKMGATAQSLPPSLFKIITKKIADPKIYLSFNDQSLSNTLWALQRMGYTYNEYVFLHLNL